MDHQSSDIAVAPLRDTEQRRLSARRTLSWHQAEKRCQIAADKLLTAIQKNNSEAALLMCAYILKKKPSTRRIRVNTEGEIQGNEFLDD